MSSASVSTTAPAFPTPPRVGRAPAPIIRVSGLGKRFPLRRRWSEILRARARRFTTALEQVSIDVAAGEIVGLLGANGAGKTTLLKILSTLVTPDAGSATVGGFDIVRDAAAARAMLAPVTANERSLDWRLSARENLRFYGTLHGLRGPRLAARVSEVLSIVELGDEAAEQVGMFSSGMRQRLLIARALLAQPRALLLDEPTRSLDPLAARAFREFLRRDIVRDQGRAVLLATHDPEEAFDLCDRVVILDRGRVRAHGAPVHLTEQFGEERYRVWLRLDGELRLPALEAVTVTPLPEHGSSDILVLDLALDPGGPDPVALLRRLVAADVPVVRFERAPTTIADLLDRVLRHGRSGEHSDA